MYHWLICGLAFTKKNALTKYNKLKSRIAKATAANNNNQDSGSVQTESRRAMRMRFSPATTGTFQEEMTAIVPR
jgi:hypothetical protein